MSAKGAMFNDEEKMRAISAAVIRGELQLPLQDRLIVSLSIMTMHNEKKREGEMAREKWRDADLGTVHEVNTYTMQK